MNNDDHAFPGRGQMTQLSATLEGALSDLRKYRAAVRVSRTSSSWRLGPWIRKHATMQQLMDLGLAARSGEGMAGKITLTKLGRKALLWRLRSTLNAGSVRTGSPDRLASPPEGEGQTS